MNSSNKLTQYDKDGLRLAIDDKTGAVFANVMSVARMCGVFHKTICKWLEVNQIGLVELRVANASSTTKAKLLKNEDIKLALSYHCETASEIALKYFGISLDSTQYELRQARQLRETRLRKVYLIGSITHRICKIGLSSNPDNRLKSLQTGSPYKLELLGTIAGTRSTEMALHRTYHFERLQGEWFKLNEAILKEFKITQKIQKQSDRLAVKPRTIALPPTFR